FYTVQEIQPDRRTAMHICAEPVRFPEQFFNHSPGPATSTQAGDTDHRTSCFCLCRSFGCFLREPRFSPFHRNNAVKVIELVPTVPAIDSAASRLALVTLSAEQSRNRAQPPPALHDVAMADHRPLDLDSQTRLLTGKQFVHHTRPDFYDGTILT